MNIHFTTEYGSNGMDKLLTPLFNVVTTNMLTADITRQS